VDVPAIRQKIESKSKFESEVSFSSAENVSIANTPECASIIGLPIDIGTHSSFSSSVDVINPKSLAAFLLKNPMCFPGLTIETNF
jgi:hypothetical protein